jgi:signal transduction histidine kinase
LAESVPAAVLAALRKERRWRGKVEICRKDGSRGLVDSHVVALVFDPTGLPAITIGVSRQITGGKLAQRDAEDASRQMEEFLAMLAHELRTPLHTIRNATALLEKAAPRGDDHVRQATAVIARQITYLTQLVGDLFDCSRAELGKLPLQKELVDIGEVLHAVAERIQPRVEDHGLTLHLSIPDAPLLAAADPVRLSQILANLLDNAVKFSRSKGHIEVCAGAEHADIVITVTDQGTGIEPRLLPHIWDSFVQGNAPSRAVDLGIGIGLSLVKRLVELHGGSVSAESRGAGMGARFVVRLPRTLPPPSL